MPHPNFQLYKHINISGKWRYCRAASYSNGKVKPDGFVVGGQKQKHEEGSCSSRRRGRDSPIVRHGSHDFANWRFAEILNLFESVNAARLHVSNLEKIPELGR